MNIDIDKLLGIVLSLAVLFVALILFYIFILKQTDNEPKNIRSKKPDAVNVDTSRHFLNSPALLDLP